MLMTMDSATKPLIKGANYMDAKIKNRKYEFNSIEELQGGDWWTWVTDVQEYRYLGYSIDETAEQFDISPKLVGEIEDYVVGEYTE